MITEWHYLSVKCVPVLLRGITSNHSGDFSCLNCYTAQKINLKAMKEYVIIMIIVM